MHRAPQAAAESEEFIMAVTVLTSDNFETEALQAKQPVLIDFFATWCGPCKMLSPVVDRIAEENPSIKVCKIDVDQEPDLAGRYGVMSIPTLVALKDGELLKKSVGVVPKEAILAMFQ